MTKKIKKCPSYNTYIREKRNLALDYAPRIYACKKCEYPVVDGYCCTYCGDSNPSSSEEVV